MKKHPALIVLKALLQGQSVSLDGYQAKLVDNKFYIRFERILETKETEVCYMPIDCPLDWFLKSCEDLSDKEIAILVCNITLNQQKTP